MYFNMPRPGVEPGYPREWGILSRTLPTSKHVGPTSVHSWEPNEADLICERPTGKTSAKRGGYFRALFRKALRGTHWFYLHTFRNGGRHLWD